MWARGGGDSTVFPPVVAGIAGTRVIGRGTTARVGSRKSFPLGAP